MGRESFELELGLNGLVKGYIWKENISIKGIVLICHGMAEHIERYDHFARFLSQNGFIVFGYDQRGHGQSANSPNEIGYMSDIDNFQILVSDLREINRFIKSKYPNLPIYLFGHSMGSFVSQRYIETYGTTISGVILSGSNLNRGIKLYFGYILAKIITFICGRKYQSKLIHKLTFNSYNKKFIPHRTKFDWLTQDEKIVDQYIKDEKCGTIFSVSFFKDFFRGLITIYHHFELIPNDLPILIISGDKDPVGEYGKGIKKLHKQLIQIGITNVDLKLYSNCRHELINEICKEKVYDDILNWLNQ